MKINYAKTFFAILLCSILLGSMGTARTVFATPTEGQPVMGTPTRYSIEIVKSQFKLYLKEGTKTLKSYDIAIGLNDGQKQKAGDMTTPTGEFFVEAVCDSTAWTHDFQDGKGEIAGAYGPWFISLETPWDGIGIHGTHNPHSIGTKASEGCIRMHNSDVAELKSFVQSGENKESGTVVIIRE